MLTEYDDAGVLLLAPLVEDALVLEAGAGAAAARPELDVADWPVACAVF